MNDKNINKIMKLIEEAKMMINEIKVDGLMADKSKSKAVMALDEAVKAIDWMNKINNNELVQFIDKWHDEIDN